MPAAFAHRWSVNGELVSRRHDSSASTDTVTVSDGPHEIPERKNHEQQR